MVPPSKYSLIDISHLVNKASLILNKLTALEELYKKAKEDSGLSDTHFHELFMAELYKKNKKSYTEFFINGKKLKNTGDKEVL
jgi:hypothetical protein